MSITISRNYDGALKLSAMMVNYYGEEFLYWKTYYGYTQRKPKCYSSKTQKLTTQEAGSQNELRNNPNLPSRGNVSVNA
jgi:hypothetical protein